MSDLNGDAFTFSESTAKQFNQPVYTSKQWAYQQDQNNGSYDSKQIIFDLAGFYNSQRFIDPQEMVMVIPVVTTLTAIGTGTTTSGLGSSLNTVGQPLVNVYDAPPQITSQHCMGFKSGYWNVIQSLQIQVDGKDVIQLTPNVNYHASFVANTTWSQSDVKKHGSMLGFYPDSCSSWAVNKDASKSQYGYGITNNGLPPARQAACYPSQQVPDSLTGVNSDYCPDQVYDMGNFGLWERMKSTNRINMDPLIYLPCADAAFNGGTNLRQQLYRSKCIATNVNLNKTLENQMFTESMTPIAGGSVNDANALTAYRQLGTNCVIRLKDVCHLFSKLPLTRGMYMRITVNVNTGRIQLKTQATLLDAPTDDTYPQYGTISENTFPSTCPIMLGPLQSSSKTDTAAAYPAASVFQVYPGIACDGKTITRTAFELSMSIAKVDPIHAQLGTVGVSTPGNILSSCRIWAPIIDMEPALVSSYITQHSDQAIYYRDILQFVQPNVSGAFTFQLANGITNAKRLIILPFYHDDSVIPLADNIRLGMTKIPFEPRSPFDSAPSTTAPQCVITAFNVLVSNMNIFQRNIDYSFETFMEEISPANAINGGLDTGLTSGLIGFKEWTENYRYYVVDLSRRLAGDNTPKSITVTGNYAQGADFPVDFYYFVEYERHLSLNIESGHINVSSN